MMDNNIMDEIIDNQYPCFRMVNDNLDVSELFLWFFDSTN